MVIVATVGTTTYSGNTLIITTNTILDTIAPNRRFIPFQLVISTPFTTGDVNPVAFTDETGETPTIYPLVDRLNKNITAIELVRYAGRRRCLKAVYDRLYQVIRICSCIDPVPLTVPTTGA